MDQHITSSISQTAVHCKIEFIRKVSTRFHINFRTSFIHQLPLDDQILILQMDLVTVPEVKISRHPHRVGAGCIDIYIRT